MPTLIQVEADFLEDVRRHYVSLLRGLGVQGRDPETAHDACLAYFNVMHRSITRRPRRVHWSRRLMDRALVLSPEMWGAIETIAVEAERGDDLWPRLSTRIRKPRFNDPLMNDWGINHLHIGERVAGRPFVRRGDDLLYVLVRETDLYFIDLLHHRNDSWANKELIEILHSDWPELSAHNDLGKGGWEADPEDMTPDERQRMRAAGVNYATTLADGTGYSGLWYSVSGLSFSVLDKADRQCEEAREVEEWVRANAEGIRDMIVRHSGSRLDKLELEFLPGDPWAVRENQSRKTLHPPAARRAA